MCIKNKIVKTKKHHECFSCLRNFPPGTKMNYWVGKYEGDFCTSYSCLTCVDIMNNHSGGEISFPEGYVGGWLKKDETPEQLLERLNAFGPKV